MHLSIAIIPYLPFYEQYDIIAADMIEALKRFKTLLPPPGEIPGGAYSLSALTGSADAFIAAALSENVMLVVAPGLPEADRIYDDLKIITAKSDIRILDFPPLLAGDKSSLGTRLKTIAALKAYDINPYPLIVVASFPALAAGVKLGAQNSISIKNGLKLNDLAEKLAHLGFKRAPQVETIGDFSVRGGIVDVWSPGEEFPIRAEFFGDEVESLRTFDPATQMSIERIQEAEILPITEEAGGKSEECRCGTLFDLLPTNTTILALEHNSYNLPSLYPLTSNFHPIYTGDPAPAGVPALKFQTTPLPGFAELGAEDAHHPELFEAARARLEKHISAAEKKGAKILKIDDLSGGFEIPDLIVVTKADRVFTKRKVRRSLTPKNTGERIQDFDELEPGEYVVHIDYGVGKFVGSSEIAVGDERQEVYTIEYADGGRLHVPAIHAHLLSRYVGVKGEAVKLHRLDGKRWAKDKEDAKRSVRDLAAALLETQARRELVPGFKYDTACEGLDAFEAAFPYEETRDQSVAIEAIKSDLSSSKPMDRLICGDAGYGKTEVAMRAAFIAAMNGKQVAVLAPTTVLAEQHFESFTSRFDGTPIRIESVSRFQTKGTHEGTFKRLASGACDIVIGTHAILSPSIQFHDLGLIIIDEEQRFGVKHKEFLKAIRATADILTLSATPIPRTLYLSMTGARDLSLLRSPPRERVAVETRVVRDSDEIIRAAIEAELNRGGQVYFLHNRVSTIHKVEKRIKDLFAHHSSHDAPRSMPRVVVAHGQMDAKTLARKMRDFEAGKYDILLSTTIIESGIDIPRANTILIDQAETFGMADLYQLRGRVGRSSRQGYAYFLLPSYGNVDAEARERLDALKKHGGLGSGFNLAVRDLELRGAGNLLGSEQSGHIAAVGFSLYCQLLKRTIALLKGEKVKEIIDVKLNLDFVSPKIPYSYIEEDIHRLNILKRFAEAQEHKAIKALSDEMIDRFGPMPEEVKTFVAVASLRVAAALKRIERIDVKDTRAVFYKNGSHEIDSVHTLKGKTIKAKIAELKRALA